MASTIPVLFTASFPAGSGWNPGKAWAGVMLNSATGTNPEANGSGDPLNYVAVFDRKNPNAGPVFQGNATNNTTVQAGLDQYLTTDYLMFWASAAFVTSMPQGALYDMLNQNGGASQLQKMEMLSTKFACGINGGLVYLLASIPNSGVEGVEFLAQQSLSTSQGKDPDYAYENAPFQMLLELIPSPNGMYSVVDPY
ncbi:MAG: hypothetical protein WBB25_05225 [Sulfitobacter sp.]